MPPLWIPLLLLAALVVWGILIYNGLVGSRNEVKNGWSQIDVQLKRRHDLIPNLVEAVRGYMTHEAGLLKEVTEARARATQAASGGMVGASAVGAAEGLLGGLLSKVFVAAEAYPDLKASTNFLALQEELSSTENRIAFARQAYNDAVGSYNTRRESFPNNLIAGGFGKVDFLTIEKAVERELPKVEV
ncbi:MAG: LemA family protein [Planctomycetota bacterium]|nr:LemA family protein [Planctomycetota bacterium]